MPAQPKTSPAPVSAKEPSPPNSEGQPDADQAMGLPVLPGVDTTLAVGRLGGNLVLYRQILWIFARNHAHVVSDIAHALAAGQRDTALRLSHTMQGAIATLGAPALAQAFFALEAAIEAGDAACASRLLAGLGIALAALVAAIDASIQW